MGKWQSVESLLQEQERDSLLRNKSDLKPNKFRSMEDVMGKRGLSRTLVDIDIDEEVDVSDRMRRYKMENGKSLPDMLLPPRSKGR